jgi:putative proteasome-type protease
MTYCVAIALEEGLVFTSDSRTNAGVDRVSTYSKMHTFGRDGDRQFVLLTSGNLATTQAVVDRLQRDMVDDAKVSLLSVGDIAEAADYLGAVSTKQQAKHGGGSGYEASFLLGGQVAGKKPAVVFIYPEGNYITTSVDTPYLQVGESKYGKPILDRIITPETSLETAALCSLVSMDSTMRSNVTVGPPIELSLYRRDSLVLEHRIRLDEDSPYLRELRKRWDERLKEAFRSLPPIAWARARERPSGGQNAAYL